MVPGTWEHSLVDDNTSQGRGHFSMAIHGHNNRYFTSNPPTGPEVILLFCSRRSLEVALIHNGIYGTRIPPTVVRRMYLEHFCKPGTCTRKGDFTYSPYTCISLNTVALKIQLLSFIKASELLTGACETAKGQKETRLTCHMAQCTAYLAAPSF